MQSRNFRLQRVGDISWLEKNYQFQKTSFALDELIILNASRDKKCVKEFSAVVSRLAQEVFIPVAAGGGIRSMENAKLLFDNGADKIVLNTALYEDCELVKKLVRKYGSQSIVASIDYIASESGNIQVYIHDGQKKIPTVFEEYLDSLEKLGVGEIYLNSIKQDGTGFGYDIITINRAKDLIKVPLIVAGGAGNEAHLLESLQIENVSAVATANLFNFVGGGLERARNKIIENSSFVINWNISICPSLSL